MYVNCKIKDRFTENLVREAAKLSGRSLCGFVRWAVVLAAKKVINGADNVSFGQ